MSLTGTLNVAVEGNPLPFGLIVGTLTAANISGTATAVLTGTTDLGTVSNDFTLVTGFTDTTFSPSFSAIVNAALTASSQQYGQPISPTLPITIGSIGVSLQGSLDNQSWYDLTEIYSTITSLDGSTAELPPVLTAMTTPSSTPLARYVSATVTLTLSGNITLTVDSFSSPGGPPAYSGSSTVTSIDTSVSVYVATKLGG